MLDDVGTELAAAVRALVRSEGVMTRLHGTGSSRRRRPPRSGALGVAARASGLDVDLRRDRPYAAYGELDVSVVTASAGDVAARFHVRAQEARESLRLLREAIGRLPAGPVARPARRRRRPRGTRRSASPRGRAGASWVWLRAGADGTIDRLRLRSASFANWPVVAAAVPATSSRTSR